MDRIALETHMTEAIIAVGDGVDHIAAAFTAKIHDGFPINIP
ncbi:hypothetical protein SFMTTN_2443 [Sulfuriferula multivorans]|uniref:Uncharacterized protein n=1 Tax=Sulfuriferula multivorans TaxID=1559896 RepID=A0A401JG73_9PROT|nr:hypothetical protein SFMTTN_2443 [Sulfuriferula multivorans]